MSAALNDGMLPRAGLLARELRSEATGVSLWMGVCDRLGTEQDMAEVGEPCPARTAASDSLVVREWGLTIVMDMASGEEGGSFSSPMPCRFMWTL